MPSRGRARTRFIVDAMLGSLARKLRALGFDATYFRSGPDADILDSARRQGRVMLTSDRGLAAAASSHGVQAILLQGKSDGARISFVATSFRRMGLPLVRGGPLCSVCGGELLALRAQDVEGMVPTSVQRRHRLFSRCLGCGKLYWRGSHWKKLRSFARRLDQTSIAPHPFRRETRGAPRPGGSGSARQRDADAGGV